MLNLFVFEAKINCDGRTQIKKKKTIRKTFDIVLKILLSKNNRIHIPNTYCTIIYIYKVFHISYRLL